MLVTHIRPRLVKVRHELDGSGCSDSTNPFSSAGMNTSMQDTFNLAWKGEPGFGFGSKRSLIVPCSAVGHVVTGLAKPELLKTYSLERQVVAKTLIDCEANQLSQGRSALTSSLTVDTKFSKLFSGKPASKDDLDEGVSLSEFKDVFATGESSQTDLVRRGLTSSCLPVQATFSRPACPSAMLETSLWHEMAADRLSSLSRNSPRSSP